MKKIPPPTWQECIKKVCEVDLLQCKHCQREMKIISFINEPDVIRKTLGPLEHAGTITPATGKKVYATTL